MPKARGGDCMERKLDLANCRLYLKRLHFGTCFQKNTLDSSFFFHFICVRQNIYENTKKDIFKKARNFLIKRVGW